MFKHPSRIAQLAAVVAIILIPTSALGGRTKPPSPPRSLTVTAVTPNSISLQWRASTGAVAGYDVSVNSAAVVTNATSYTATSLACATAYSISVTAFDSFGNVSGPASISASTSSCPVSPPPPVPDTIPPSSTISCNGAACTSSSYSNAVSVALAASDNTGGSGVASIHYTTNGTDPSLTNGSTYSSSFSVAATTTVKYRSFDNAGNAEPVNAQQIQITVTPTPAVALTSPAAGTTVSGTATLAATDTAAAARVDFRVDGKTIGSDSSTPYNVSWDSSAATNGTHQVTAAAFDSANQEVDSPPVSISVSNGSPPPASSGFVTASGTHLSLGGQPYRFVGLNFFQTNMTAGIPNCSGWAANSDLDNQLTGMGPGHNVIRAWFFQDMATSNGGRDWSAFDHTLAVAKTHGYKVIATLGDQWNYCEGPYKDESWYAGGYKTTVLPGDTVPYRSWVQEVVSRYKDDPTVLMWELVNEAEDQTSETGSCPTNAESVMYSFASDVSGLVKGADPNHLVSLGGGGNGGCGTDDTDFQKVMAIPTLDVCSIHDYWGATVAISADPYNGIQKRISDCTALGKPIYTGESGVKVQDVSSLSQRATLFSAKLVAQFTAGVSGFVAWNWYHASDMDYRIGPGDPSLSAVATLALP
jgi:mannan endo-1,4-beta-mannosidase